MKHAELVQFPVQKLILYVMYPLLGEISNFQKLVNIIDDMKMEVVVVNLYRCRR
jgi:hypothetical protein